MNLLDGLVIAYHLDGDLEPAHGYRALQGSVLFSQGKFGQAAVFSSGQYVSAPWNLLGPGQSRSVSVWAKPQVLGRNATWVSAGDTSVDPDRLWEIGQNSLDSIIVAYGGEATPVSLLVPDTWYNLVYTFDAATATTKLYVDGQLVATTVGFPDVAPTLNNSTLYVGTGKLSSVFSTPFVGAIDELAIWGHALSDSEVLEVSLAPYPFGESSCQVSWDDDLLVYSSGFQAALGVRTPSSEVGSWD